MSEAGWIKIHRKIKKSSMYKSFNSKQRDVMMQVLLKASYKEIEWEWEGEMYKLKPGQLITSLESIRKECANDVKIQSVRTALLKMEKWQFLTNESTKRGRLITIVKWEDYQGDDDDTNKVINKQLTNSQQTTNKQLTTIKNIKEGKEREESNISEKITNFSAESRNLANKFSKTLTNKKLIPDTESKKEKWLKCFDDCHRIDGYSYEQIGKIIERFRNDEWWRPIFLSPLKLRKRNREGVKYIDLFWSKIAEEDEGLNTDDLKTRSKNIEKMKKWGWTTEQIRESYPDYQEE